MRSLGIAVIILVGAVGCGDNKRIDPLDASDLTIETAEDTAVSFAVPTNALAERIVHGSVVVGPQHGMVIAIPDGTWTYTPAPDYNGADSLRLRFDDGIDTVDVDVTVAIASVDDAPVANPDSFATAVNTPVVIERATLLANDTDPEGQSITFVGASGSVHGSSSVGATSITFTPDGAFMGDAGFDYEITDGEVTATGHVTIAVNTDRAPVAAGDALATAEDVPLVVSTSAVLANDSDPDGQTLAVSLVGNFVHCTVTRAGTTLTIVPEAEFHGSASFEYTVTDGQLTDTATVGVTVGSVPDAPVGVVDSLVTPEDTNLVLVASTLATNDTDADGDTLSVTAVSSPVNGTVVLVGGTITFSPTANVNGVGGFDYTVSDGMLVGTGHATVAITPIADAPIAVDDSAATDEDVAIVIDAATLVANDTDGDGEMLAAVAAQNPTHGTVAFVGGQVTFTPDPNFFGIATFDYTVSDTGLTDIGTVSITVTSVNDLPIANADAIGTDEDVVGTANVVANDFDVEGPLMVAAFSQPSHGSVAITPAGDVTYTPVLDYRGADAFDYTIADGSGAMAMATVTVTVGSVNDAPVAVADAIATAEDTPGSVDVTLNDSDVDGDVLTVASFTPAAHGTVSFAGTVATYTPVANYSGPDSFTYTVFDGVAMATATVSVTVAEINDPPIANPDSTIVVEDSLRIFDPTQNDTDADGDPLTITGNTTPGHGTVTFAGNVATYTPAADYAGPDSFDYTISDGRGGSATATVAITVSAVPDAPDAIDDALATTEDVSNAIDVSANDTDGDGDALIVTGNTSPAHGTVTFAGNVATYTPDANYSGPDSFDYTISDGGLTDTATVTVAVAEVNDPPVAAADTLATNEDVPGNVDVAANDVDVDGDPRTITGNTNGAHGAVTFAGNVATYTPDPNYFGLDAFAYTISDGRGGTDTATVSIMVASVNDAPVAIDVTATTAYLTPVGITLVASDIEGSALTYTVVAPAAHGTVSIAGATATYTPEANFSGPDSFTYRAFDGAFSNIATATITVGPNPCGDGDVDIAEECDDGNANDGDGCDRACRWTCGSGTGAIGVAVDGFAATCFAAYPTAMSHDAADAFCANLGGHLAVIGADHESAAVALAAASVPLAWIGLEDRAVPNNYVWSTNEVVGFTAWAAGSPIGGVARDCAVSSAVGWQDVACSSSARPVCEFERFPDVERMTTGGINDLELADIDGDGDLDFAGTHDRSIAMNNGAGAFAYTFTALPAELDGSTTLRFADVDGDSDQDLIRFSDATMRVQLDTNGAFGAPIETTLPPSWHTTDPRFADLDDDGDVDMVIGDVFNARYAVYRGQGDGTFALVAVNLLADYAGSLEIVDWDHDGANDLLVTQRNNAVAIFAGDDAFGFTLAGTLPAIDAKWLRTADFDADGILDVAVLTATALHVFLDDGTGGIASQSTVPVAGALALRLAIGDLDGDTHLDIVVESVDRRLASIFYGVSSGAFTTPGAYLAHNDFGFYDLEIGDVDGDGIDDLLLALGGQPQLALYRGSASRRFVNMITAPPPQLTSPEAVASGDLDGDGRDDLVVLDDAGATLRVLHNTGTGYSIVSSVASTLGTATAPFHVRLGDVDGDGDLDVVASGGGASGGVVRFANAGGTLTLLNAIFVATDVVDIALADLDGNGVRDLVTAKSSGLVQTYSGLATTHSFAVVAGGSPTALAVGDFTHDAFLDFVVTDSSSASLHFGQGIAGLAFTTPVAIDSMTGLPQASIAAGDIDGDGNLDVSFAGVGFGVRILAGDGLGDFSTVIDDHGGDASRIVVDDYDRDGQLDLAYVTSKAAFVARHRPDGYFTDPFERSTGDAVDLAVVHDAASARCDIVTIDRTLGRLQVFRDGWR